MPNSKKSERFHLELEDCCFYSFVIVSSFGFRVSNFLPSRDISATLGCQASWRRQDYISRKERKGHQGKIKKHGHDR
jgi:hypothetical protein